MTNNSRHSNSSNFKDSSSLNEEIQGLPLLKYLTEHTINSHMELESEQMEFSEQDINQESPDCEIDWNSLNNDFLSYIKKCNFDLILPKILA